MHTRCQGHRWAGRAPCRGPTASSFSLPEVVQGPPTRWSPGVLNPDAPWREVKRPFFRAEGTQAAAPCVRQREACPLWGHVWGRRPVWCPGCSVTTPSNSRMFISPSGRPLEEIGTGPPACRELRGDGRGRHTGILGPERLWYVLRRVWERWRLSFPGETLESIVVFLSPFAHSWTMRLLEEPLSRVVYGWKFLELFPESSNSHPPHKYTSKVTNRSSNSR